MKLSGIAGMVLIVMLANACKEPKQQPGKNDKDTSRHYLPVAGYLKNEIKLIDSLPVGILKRVSNGSSSDSVFIKPDQFKQLAAAFLPKELEQQTFERLFTESSFVDQTTESLTFTYQTTDTGSLLRRVDVILSPGLDLDKIKSIYMEKAYKTNDTGVIEKLYWKANTMFYIITEKTFSQQASVQQVRVIWDPLKY